MLMVMCLVPALLAGCAHLPQSARSIDRGGAGMVGRCAEFFALLDDRTKTVGVRDAGEFRVAGYPYLRVNRFLASFRDDVENASQFDAWVARLQTLDRVARRYEMANLDPSERGSLQRRTGSGNLHEEVLQCGDVLRSADFADAQQRNRLKRTVHVPDEYLAWRRAAGLYPLPLLFLAEGVKKLHAKSRQDFSNSRPQNPLLIRYFPVETVDGRPSPRLLIGNAKQDALGIPIYAPATISELFAWYAPIWEVEDRANYDHIGVPEWTQQGNLRIKSAAARTYRRLSYTRFNGRVLAQLNYIIWFPERPRQSFLDLVGGHMDGINYRVTLGLDGQPLLYETVHNCGCYLKFYPTSRLQPRTPPECTEPPLILPAPAFDATHQRMVISMESGSHYVRHLYTVPRSSGSHRENPRRASLRPETESRGSRDSRMPVAVPHSDPEFSGRTEKHPSPTFGQSPGDDRRRYELSDYDELRSLPTPGDARRSMFDERGMVPGTERLERFILWSTGVANPGAMRQWGRHAVAFMGERHLDDPDLMEKLFTYADDFLAEDER